MKKTINLGNTWHQVFNFFVRLQLKAAIPAEFDLREGTLPPELDPHIYRRLHKDLAHMDDNQLLEHYNRYGKPEGRVSNGLVTRKQFASLVTHEMRALEIGPLAAPLLHGDNVSYCDILDRDGLKKRAGEFGLNPDSVPHIHHVLGPQGLDGFTGEFDAILSSHCIEHQPNLVHHLQQVQRKLKNDGGRYFILIPDKRYCFDKHIAPSTIADAIQAYEEQRVVHTLRSVIEAYSSTTHNNPRKHWRTLDAEHHFIDVEKVRNAINDWRNAKGRYMDVHAWYLTPDSFKEIIGLLRSLNLITLTIERIYSTRFESNEFWAVLKN
ncbi:MAG: class I SAM-dependent methyltransferase [Nitrosospira sp.]|nr:class I SAM-dependent methyltransferase [Nitrosospira sp.]